MSIIATMYMKTVIPESILKIYPIWTVMKSCIAITAVAVVDLKIWKNTVIQYPIYATET